MLGTKAAFFKVKRAKKAGKSEKITAKAKLD